MRRRLLLTCGLAVSLIFVTLWMLRPVQAAPTVLTFPDCGLTLQDCLDAANPGDTVNITLTATYIGSLALTKPVSLTASVPGVIIQADANNRVLLVSGSAISQSVIISNVTLQGGSVPDGSGGGVYVDNGAQIQFVNVTVTNNIAQTGGGVYVTNDSVFTQTGGSIDANQAEDGGGVYVYSGRAALNETAIRANTAITNGGGLFSAFGRVDVSGGVVRDNQAGSQGGGVYVFGLTASYRQSGGTLRNNRALNGNGGGVYVGFGSTQLDNVTTINNQAWSGGGLYGYYGPVTVTGGSLGNNSASNSGGGLYAQASVVTIANTTVTGNSASSGGGLYFNLAPAMFANLQISNNQAWSNGGGFYLSAGTMTLTNVVLDNNQAGTGGGAYAQNGALTFNGGQLTRNRATGGNGGGLYNGSQTVMQGTLITNNVATSSGGGIYQGGSFTAMATAFFSNTAAADGGGLAVLADLKLTGATFVSNTSTSSRGGGVYHSTGVANIQNAVFTANTASSQGGGFYSNRLVTFTAASFVANSSYYGGAIANCGSATTLNTGYFFNNQSGGYGGALYLCGQNWLSGTQLISNTARWAGGGLYSSGNAIINNGIFDKNSTTDPGGSGGHIVTSGRMRLDHTRLTNGAADYGGALRNYGLLTITASSLVFNRAYGSFGEGGAIRNSGPLAMINSTLAYNSADTAGGALFSTDWPATLINDTLDHNTAFSGGGLFANNAIGLANSIVSQGGCAGSIIDNSHNLQYPDATCGASIDVLNPGLGVLGDYGDGTYAYALLPTSPARDAANAALCPSTDQRGVARPIGPGCDIGAFELPDGELRVDAVPLPGNSSQADTTTDIQQVKWYVLNVPEPGSDITVTLSGLKDDFDLFLFAPAATNNTGQLQDWNYLLNPDGTPVESAAGVIIVTTDGVPIVTTAGVIIVTTDGAGGNPGALRDQWQDARRQPNVCFNQNIGQMGNSAQSGGIGTLLCLSAQSGLTNELVALNSRELYGPFYIAVTGHNVFTTGLPYTLTTQVVPNADSAYAPVDYHIAVTFTELMSDTNVYSDVKTLILFQPDRMSQVYGAPETAVLSQSLNMLAAQPQVKGRVIDLSDFEEIRRAYDHLAQHPDQPQAANIVATEIKMLLYNLMHNYPNAEYLVLVGGDSIIPYRRLRDETEFSNERRYAELSAAPAISEALAARYFLSDDYYANAALYPLVWHGRELYLPQLGTGRLVESPDDIINLIDAFISQPILTPTNALVTGYDFLIDQAQAVSATLSQRGITTITSLINNTWTAGDLRSQLIGVPQAPDINALNAHFTHYALIPASVPVSPTLSDYVFATEITATTWYSNALVLSVGCHSGLNIPDETATDNPIDWAQAFSRQGAAFFGNTGYGYGSSDTIALSEKMMNNIVDELGYLGSGAQRVNGLPTLGGALMRAKQRYYNAIGPSGFSTYDEKVMEQVVLYGLPMQAVQLPNPIAPPDSHRPMRRLSAATAVEPISLTFTYSDVNLSTGAYYTLTNLPSPDLQVAGARPIEPRSSLDLQVSDAIAHGALMVGGMFSDTAGFDPALARIITDELYSDLAVEPTFNENAWYPAQVGGINRFWAHNQQSQDRLVVVPGQFKPDLAASTPTHTIGTQRLYSSLQFEIYRSPISETDYIAPSIWQVEAISTTLGLRFHVNTTDQFTVTRVIVLYRQTNEFSWTKKELIDNPATGDAETTVPLPTGPIEYFAQAVDTAGNVALALDHGKPFTQIKTGAVSEMYLPVIMK